VHFNPENARIDFMSTTFGRPSDFEETTTTMAGGESRDMLEASITFDRQKAGPPKQEPWFGTYYWFQDLDINLIQRWKNLSCPQLPPHNSMLSLPPKNLFVPSNFEIKPTPPEDCGHPLLNCSLKLCIPVGKQKVWVTIGRIALLMLPKLIRSHQLLSLFKLQAMAPWNCYQVQ
jgi:secreted Zn-dependent insulinase-like peptidase